MEQLPPEILIKIFDFVNDFISLIAISQTSKRFNEIIKNHVRTLSITFDKNITKGEIETASKEIQEIFLSLKSIELAIEKDEWLDEKTQFLKIYSKHIKQLTLKDVSFLNTIFGVRNFTSLIKLQISKCDLTSSSSELTNFILQGCIRLKYLGIWSCEGLDVGSLNELGKNLKSTNIVTFQLLPSFAYFDIQNNDADYWRIENLKTLSVSSSNKEVVVMKKGFIRTMLGRSVCKNLVALKLAAEINCGENFVPLIIRNFPNLNNLVLGRGVSAIKMQDFIAICNGLKHLKKLEFHFNGDFKDLKMLHLKRNSSIEELVLGLTEDFPIENLKIIKKCLLNIKNLSVIYYNFKSSTSQEYRQQVYKIFPKLVQFHRTGQFQHLICH